jgi:hypothetical protein
MSSKKIFTDKELKEMGTRTLDAVCAAIDAGDKKKAKELAQRMLDEFKHLHDGYFFWVTGLQSYIYRKLGVKAVEEAERQAHTIEAKVVFTPPEKNDLRTRVEHLASGLRGHMQPIAIEEDDEKITLTMQPCGSGERLINMKGYEVGLARVKEAHPITWGQKNFPMYCVHCPVMEMLDFENSGNLATAHFISDPIGKEHCVFVLYKNTKDIPEEFYKRIGKKKPSATSKK